MSFPWDQWWKILEDLNFINVIQDPEFELHLGDMRNPLKFFELGVVV